MTKRDKLVQRFLRRPAEVTFGDVEALMKSFGVTLRSQRGSHTVWRRDDGRKLTVPRKGGRKVVQPYINQIIEFLDLEGKES